MQIRAREPMYYAGRERVRGEVFETETDEHARLLTLNGKAEYVTADEKPKRGNYRRRDMRADE